MTIKELMADSQRIAAEHGFTSRVEAGLPELFSEKVLLMVGELCEAMEEFRAGHGLQEIYHIEHHQIDGLLGSRPLFKPEGIPIELADAVIRIAEFCASNDIDLEEAIRLKQQYNEGRPHRHGKKF